MKKKKNVLLFIASFCLLALSTNLASAQYDSTEVIESISLDGPRAGFTYISHSLPNEWRSLDMNPVVSQFGWQFETRFFTLPSGTAGLIEWVVLVGGLEQNLFLPSLTCLVGIRSRSGLELGFGPNISVAGAAFAFAGGVTMRSHHVNFPINIAVVPSKEGVRVSLLVGFNKRKK